MKAEAWQTRVVNVVARTEIAREYHFEAAHRLPQVARDHKCARLHGHSFRVTIVVEGDVDPETGWIMDFARIDEAWRPLYAILDHQYLNEIPGLENPTSENLAALIAGRMDLPVARVTVHETCTATCTVYTRVL